MHTMLRPRSLAIGSLGLALLAASTVTTGARADASLPPAPVPPTIQKVTHLLSPNGSKNLTNPGDGTVYWPLADQPFIIGHDNGQSAGYRTADGRMHSFWSFGDTGLDQPNDNGDTFIGNTGAWTTDLQLKNNISLDYENIGASGRPSQFVTLTPEEEAYNLAHRDADPDTDGCQPKPGIPADECGYEFAIWGSSVIADEPNSRVLAYYSLIKRTPNIGWGVTGIGSGFAIWSEATGQWTRATITNPTDPSIPTVLWPYVGEDETDYDKMPVIRTDDGVRYLYSYNCEDVWRQCKLGRVSLDDPAAVTDRSAYEFLIGLDSSATPTFGPDINQSIYVSRYRADGSVENLSTGSASGSMFYYAPDDVYMSIFGPVLTNDIVYSVAKAPWGPFSAPEKITTAAKAQGTSPLGSLSYATFAHPEYAKAGGRRQYITYSHLTSDLSSDMPIVEVTFND